MRFLCLHGAGTNAKIFEVQLATLKYELSKDRDITLEFLDGECNCPAAEGVSGLFEPPYFCWFTYDCTTIAEAHDLILSVVEEEGPFDGVIGFSQGAAIASSIIIHHAETHPLEPQYSLFRCAIFVCGGLPPNYEGTRLLNPERDGQLIKIPTAHLVGKKDKLYNESMGLYGLCDRAVSGLYDHGQGHDIPRDTKKAVAMAEVIKTAIDRALLMQ